MKHLLFLLVTFIAISCQKEQTNPDPSPSGDFIPKGPLPDLTLETAKQYVPIELFKNKSHAIFVNETGEELPFELMLKERILTDYYREYEYQTTEIEIIYNQDFLPIVPHLRLREHYHETDTIQAFVSIHLFNDIQWYFPTIYFLSNSRHSYCTLEPSVTIANRTFHNVYTTCVVPGGSNSYGLLYHTVDQGIVAFQGKYGEMWALDRFE